MRAAKLKERPGFSLMKQTDIQNLYYMQMPRWLFSDPRYADMGVDRTPDEVAKEREKERKRVEEVNRLVSTPGAMDRRLARLARLYSFCEWNLRAGMVGMLLAIVVVLVHTFVIEISMSFIAVFAVVISIALVIGMIGSFWVQKQQKKLSLHYTPEVLEAVLDRLELYDHKGSVDHGYLWEDFSYPEREWVGPCADHVKGVLKGMPLEFSEFCFQYEDVSRDDDGKIKRETRTSFNGMMVVCRHGFRLKNKVTLTQFNLFRHALRTESMEFTSVWSIREDAGQDAFYILTPHYMEKLVALDRDKWMKMGIQFQPNGTLLIVMQGVDFFEAEESKSADELKEWQNEGPTGKEIFASGKMADGKGDIPPAATRRRAGPFTRTSWARPRRRPRPS